MKAIGDDTTTKPAADPSTPEGRQVLELDDMAGMSSAPPGAATTSGRLPPDKQALQSALQATLDALQADPRRGGFDDADAPRRKLTLTTVLGAIVVFIAIIAGGYGLHALGRRQAEIEAEAARPIAHVRIVDEERTSVAEALTALRSLQELSRVETNYRTYFNRVAFVKTDVERALQAVKDTPTRTAVTEALSLHILAASAWRAKTLNERERWETIGEDPLAEACAGTKRLLTVSEDAANMSRAHWRGLTLAAGVPLLWDCAGERLAALERGLNAKPR